MKTTNRRCCYLMMKPVGLMMLMVLLAIGAVPSSVLSFSSLHLRPSGVPSKVTINKRPRSQHHEQRLCNDDAQSYHHKRAAILLRLSAGDDADESSSSSGASFNLDSLKSRMQEVADQDTKLPIIVIDTMLPRQVLKIEANEDVFTKLVKAQLEKETPFFGMVGMATLQTGQTLPLQNGVEVEIIGKPTVVEGGGLRVALRAGRRFRITGELNTAKEGWTQARVRFFDSAEEERAEEKGSEPLSLARAMSLAREFTSPNKSMPGNKSLVERWIELARQNERNPGQIDELLKDLGEIPPDHEPSERAFWVGALINPLPGMGVSLEIRPQLLMARTAEERVGTALAGILASIQHMDGTKTLF